MKRPHMIALQRVLLLLVLLLMAPKPVKAEADNSKPSPLWVGLMTPDIQATYCIGAKQEIEFYFSYLYYTESGVLPPPVPLVRNADVNVSAKKGTVSQNHFPYPWIKLNSVDKGKFTYKAGKEEGQETIDIKVTMGHHETTLSISFMVKKCHGSLQFNQSTTLSYEMVSVISNYFGSGSLRADDNGQISGSGVQAIWGDIPPFSANGGTCTHTPPWEGSSGITFSGQVGEDIVIMEMEALSVNSSILTCVGEGSGGMPFPAYTFSSCRVPLTGFNFEAATLDVPFDCPGEAPYTVAITIIPRSEP